MLKKIIFIFAGLMGLTACCVLFSHAAFAGTLAPQIRLNIGRGFYEIPQARSSQWQDLTRLSAKGVHKACFTGAASDVVSLVDRMVMAEGKHVMDYERVIGPRGDVVVFKMNVNSPERKLQVARLAIHSCGSHRGSGLNASL